MRAADSTGAEAPNRAIDRATGLALALPPLALAAPAPLALLAGNPAAELTGTGWALLFCIPLALLLILRRAAPAPRGLTLLLGVAAAGAISTLAFAPVDTLESDRAVALALIAATAFLGGASLGRPGRAWFARGLVLTSICATATALAGGYPFAGPMQNTGATSELALGGALAGAWLFAGDRTAKPMGPLWRGLGAAALLGESFYAGRAPVLAAVVALCAVLSLGAVLSAGRGDRRRVLVLAGLAIAALLVGWSSRPPVPSQAVPSQAGQATGQAPVTASTPSDERHDLGGAGVRLAIWGTLPKLALDHPWFGLGPGQFAAAYPPYRDPGERRLSEALLGGVQTEVEHVHNDWLQGPLEVGLVGGSLWVLFLLLCTARASADLRGQPERAVLAAAALGLLVNALLRAPLLWNPGSAAIGFAAFGAVLAREEARSQLGRAAVFAALVGLGLHLGDARAIATGQREDSVMELSRAARSAEVNDPSRAVEAWEAVLAVRPHRREALIQSANALARSGQLEPAQRRWRYALALSPGDPAILNNLMRSAAFAGDIDGALGWHAQAGFEPDRLAVLAFALLQEQADIEGARRLFDRAEAPYRDLGPTAAHELAGRLDAEGLGARANVLRGYAQLAWARQHVAQGDPASAVRSYRQAVSGLGVSTADGHRAPPRVRYELAAALVLSGQPDRGGGELPPPPHDAKVLRDLPGWVGDAILPLLMSPGE